MVDDIDLDSGDAGVTTNSLTPTIKDDEGNEVTPFYTETLRMKSDNDTITHRTLCGDSEVESVGEKEWQITIEGSLLLSQAETLREMRPADRTMRIITDLSPQGYQTTFDRVIFEQRDEDNTGQTQVSGEIVEEPLVQFQLQTKDDNTQT